MSTGRPLTAAAAADKKGIVVRHSPSFVFFPIPMAGNMLFSSAHLILFPFFFLFAKDSSSSFFSPPLAP